MLDLESDSFRSDDAIDAEKYVLVVVVDSTLSSIWVRLFCCVCNQCVNSELLACRFFLANEMSSKSYVPADLDLTYGILCCILVIP